MPSTIHPQDGSTLVTRAPALLYPTLLIAGIAVIILSMLGIAAMTGLLPQAQSQSQASADERGAGSKTAPPAVAAARCSECGVVERVRAVEVRGEGSGLGAVAGGVVGGLLGNQVGGGRGRTAMTVVGAGAGAYAGHEVEKNMKKSISHEIRVRMDDGSYRTFRAAQPGVGVGQRVKVRDGRLVDAG